MAYEMHFKKAARDRTMWRSSFGLIAIIALLVALGIAIAGIDSGSSDAKSLTSVPPPSSVPSSVVALAEPPLPYEGGGALEQAKSNDQGLRVLFVGNSFVHRNNMVAMLNELSKRDKSKKDIFAVQFAPLESTLTDKVDSPEFDSLLHAAKWDVVVLQEQSKIPSFSDSKRRAQMDPAVRNLHDRIDSIGARTELFLTWGYKDGDDINVPGDTYEAMHDRLAQGYFTVGREQHIPVVPIGLSWRDAYASQPDLDLWYSDSRHPSQLGSYFTARLFYKTLTGSDPPDIS